MAEKLTTTGQNQAKKKDPEEIPVLKYGPANNFTKFKEALLKKALLKKYKNIGKLIKLGKYYEPEDSDATDDDIVNDPMGKLHGGYEGILERIDVNAQQSPLVVCSHLTISK